MADSGPSRRASKPCRLVSARVGENHVGSTWHDASDAGAALASQIIIIIDSMYIIIIIIIITGCIYVKT